MKILYAEDNETNQALVERVARARNHTILFRDEGEGALEILAQDPDIDLVLLDIELAGSLSGLDVVKTLRGRGDSRPIVAVTAYAMMGDRERMLSAGCDQYLPKPLVISDLLALIDEYDVRAIQAAAQPAAPVAAAAPPAIPETAPAKVTPAEVTPAQVTPAAASPATTPETAPAQVPPALAAAAPVEAAAPAKTETPAPAQVTPAAAEVPPAPASPDQAAVITTPAPAPSITSAPAAPTAAPAAAQPVSVPSGTNPVSANGPGETTEVAAKPVSPQDQPARESPA
ncbi:MAG: response regulator [Anaerolineae bacterium]|nr:response regulator [Anaerolineae bacterium]